MRWIVGWKFVFPCNQEDQPLPEFGRFSSGWIIPGLLVSREKSRNCPELFSKLVWSVGLCGLPQFDRISLRVMDAGKPSVGIRLRVNLDFDSGGL